MLSGGGAGGADSTNSVDLSPVERVSGWLVGQLPSGGGGNSSEDIKSVQDTPIYDLYSLVYSF